MKLTRRSMMGGLAVGGLAAGALAAPMISAQTRPRIVVIGGGAGGATAAQRLAGDFDVTLIEPTRRYYTCFFSNLYLGGFWDLDDLAHGYGGLAARGVNVIHDHATDVDRDSHMVTLTGGGTIPYDRLIVAPGIDFIADSVPGWSVSAQNAMPHAYRAGSQTHLLRAQLAAMPEGGVFAVVAPPNPYRCPPGPYERVCMSAHYLSQHNPGAKILVIDPKEAFSKQGLFEAAWRDHYPGMIERIGPDFGADNIAVDPEAMTVDIDGMTEQVDVCNVIPAQKAGRIAEIAGLTDASGWAPVHPEDMRSRMDDAVYVLGDATDPGDMPKSGFSANSQAKVCAQAIRAALLDAPQFPARYANTCWSLLGPEDGVKVGAAYAPEDDRIAMRDSFLSAADEGPETRRQTWRESIDWYRAITAEMFG